MPAQLVFHGVHNVFWMLACVIGVGLVLILVCILKRHERHLVTPRTARCLMALRISVLLVLVFVLLQPVFSWTNERDRTGRLVVAFDLSESMASRDEHATAIEKLRWARAIGAVGNSRIDAQLDEWEQQLDGQDDGSPDALDAELDDSLRLALEPIDELSRREMARRLLTETSAPLMERLSNLAGVDLLVFAGRVQAQDPSTLGEVVTEVPEGLLPDVSDITRTLDAALNENRDSTLLGVVLITDGRDTGDGEPLAAAARIAQLNAPVFPILVGSTYRPQDLALLSVNYPPTVFADDQPVIEANLSAVGYSGTQIEVILEDEDGNQQAKQIQVDAERVKVEFGIDAGNPGRRGYRVHIPPQPGEARDDNNERAFAISVVDDTIQTLLVDGAARWEFRFIDNALTRDSRVNVNKVVFDQPYIGALPDTFFPRELPFDGRRRQQALEILAEADVVLIGDVAPVHMTESDWELLEHYVSEAGGTVVLCSGKNHFPLRHDSPTLQRLLPVHSIRELNLRRPAAAAGPGDRGMRLALTDDGDQFPFLRLASERHRNHLIWSSFPGHPWMQVGIAKPGATVLAVPRAIDGDLDLDTQRRYGAIVHQHFGFGQVIWLGLDSTFRWRHRVGDIYHHKFWGQICRWAADNKVAAGNEFVRFGPQVVDSVEGEDVVLLARWVPSFLAEHPDLEAAAEIYRIAANGNAQLFSTIPLTEDRQRANITAARAIGLPVGRYKVKLTCSAFPPDTAAIESPLYVHGKQTAELADLSANVELLQEIAERTGGQLLYPHQLASFPDLLQQRLHLSVVNNEVELWDHWLLLVAFFSLLSAEWILRKLNGLP